MHDINYYELFDNELFTKVKPDCWDQICVGSRESFPPHRSGTQSQHLPLPLICYL